MSSIFFEGPWKNQDPISVDVEAEIIHIPFQHIRPSLIAELMDYAAEAQPEIWEQLAEIQQLLIG